MPDGEHRTPKTIGILNKIHSFFKSKANHHEINLEEQTSSKNLTDFYKLTAEDAMIPRADITAIEAGYSLEEIAKVFLESRHTRMPVYKQKLDNIIGFINIKDILPFLIQREQLEPFSIDKLIRNLLIISPSMKIFNLLEKMRYTRTHIALVVDEFGGADGLVTIEDLVEELIGEIKDEHDNEFGETEFKQIKANCYEVSGRLEISDLEKKLNMELTNDGEYDTVGGLILSISGHVPEKGNIINDTSSGLSFQIIDSDLRRIKKVIITKNSQEK